MKTEQVLESVVYAKERDDEKLKIIDHDLLHLSSDYYNLSFTLETFADCLNPRKCCHFRKILFYFNVAFSSLFSFFQNFYSPLAEPLSYFNNF